tara:strand:+ start:178 stop:411 length:234 start_codon:yes stop_codon:yes gene_type:complete
LYKYEIKFKIENKRFDIKIEDIFSNKKKPPRSRWVLSFNTKIQEYWIFVVVYRVFAGLSLRAVGDFLGKFKINVFSN